MLLRVCLSVSAYVSVFLLYSYNELQMNYNLLVTTFSHMLHQMTNMTKRSRSVWKFFFFVVFVRRLYIFLFALHRLDVKLCTWFLLYVIAMTKDLSFVICCRITAKRLNEMKKKEMIERIMMNNQNQITFFHVHRRFFSIFTPKKSFYWFLSLKIQWTSTSKHINFQYFFYVISIYVLLFILFFPFCYHKWHFQKNEVRFDAWEYKKEIFLFCLLFCKQ